MKMKMKNRSHRPHMHTNIVNKKVFPFDSTFIY